MSETLSKLTPKYMGSPSQLALTGFPTSKEKFDDLVIRLLALYPNFHLPEYTGNIGDWLKQANGHILVVSFTPTRTVVIQPVEPLGKTYSLSTLESLHDDGVLLTVEELLDILEEHDV